MGGDGFDRFGRRARGFIAKFVSRRSEIVKVACLSGAPLKRWINLPWPARGTRSARHSTQRTAREAARGRQPKACGSRQPNECASRPAGHGSRPVALWRQAQKSDACSQFKQHEDKRKSRLGLHCFCSSYLIHAL
jgi:hypothetical protein